MNIEDNNNDDLSDADFENVFFNGEPVEQETVEGTEEEVEDQVDEEDSGDDEVDPPATEEDEDENEPEEDDKPKGKNRKSAQERINELTAKARQEEREKIAAERREAELIRRLEELEAVVKKETVEAKPLREQLSEGAPNPDAKDDKGEPLYELGEFDPKFIRDLTKFTIEQETKAAREAAAQEAQQKAFQEAQQKLQTEWLDKLEKYEAEVPEVRENITYLTEVFQDIEPNYGEYLAATIMSSDVGPQLMDYLSQNIGEAQKIVASGPAAATLALGRLEARLLKSSTEVENIGNKKKVSDAPAPPEERTRGMKGQFAVRPDTDDQRAFEREFFKK